MPRASSVASYTRIRFGEICHADRRRTTGDIRSTPKDAWHRLQLKQRHMCGVELRALEAALRVEHHMPHHDTVNVREDAA